MKALILNRSEGPEAVTLQEVGAPVPAVGEVRIALKAASLNHRELWICRGQYPGLKLPTGLGSDGAGIIDAVGSGVDPSLVGRDVVLYPGIGWGDDQRYPDRTFALFGMPLPGTLAYYICAPVQNAVEKPVSLTFEEAACLPTAGVTAWRALNLKARVAPGDKVLVTGIGGGVASLSLKLALALGAKVYVTSGSDDKLQQAELLGASGGVNYRQEKWGMVLGKLSGGIDVVIDGAPAGSLTQYSRCLNLGARVVIYGATSGSDVHFSAPDLFLRHATLFGTTMGTLEDFRLMLDFVARHGIRPVIDRRFTLDTSAQSLLSLQNDHGLGKVTVTI
ncbi:MAG: zinc-binding dehydrogenase [Burkholderiales bacterium]|nr:zinc-binding dehydrogenase [Burkholderiales bacterium]